MLPFRKTRAISMQDVSLFIQHHPALCLSFLIVVFLAASIEYIRLRQQATQVNPTTAVLLMNRENAVVLDVRSKEAWSAGHISGAVNLPFPELPQSDKKTDKFRAHPIIVTCGTGTDSLQAAAYLQQKGLDARVLAGGMPAWLSAGLPVIRS